MAARRLCVVSFIFPLAAHLSAQRERAGVSWLMGWVRERMATPLLYYCWTLVRRAERFISPGSSHHQGILIWHESSERCSPPPPSGWVRKNQERALSRGRSSVIDRLEIIIVLRRRPSASERLVRFNLSEGFYFYWLYQPAMHVGRPACSCVYLSCTVHFIMWPGENYIFAARALELCELRIRIAVLAISHVVYVERAAAIKFICFI